MVGGTSWTDSILGTAASFRNVGDYIQPNGVDHNLSTEKFSVSLLGVWETVAIVPHNLSEILCYRSVA